jgi:electron transfer flavoprotein beta subunit
VKILSLLKQVPDPDSLRFDGSGRLAPNTTRVVNEYDEYGLEAALRLKEADDSVDLAVLSVGPPTAKDAVSRGLAMGADRGILLISDAPNRGSLETARGIAKVAGDEKFDLIWLGHESSDSGTGNLGPQLSALLEVPFVTNVVAFELEESGSALITREIEDGHAQVRASLPLILCALSGLDEPRYPSLKGIMAARRKPVTELAFESLEAEASDVVWGDLREEERTISGMIIDTEDPEEAAMKLVALLQERNLI